MRKTLTAIDGPVVSIDLDEVVLIEQHGQRTSASGWVTIRLALKSGAKTELKMPPQDYDQLILDWNPAP